MTYFLKLIISLVALFVVPFQTLLYDTRWLFTRPAICCPPLYIYSYGQLNIINSLWCELFYAVLGENGGLDSTWDGNVVEVDFSECKFIWNDQADCGMYTVSQKKFPSFIQRTAEGKAAI